MRTVEELTQIFDEFNSTIFNAIVPKFEYAISIIFNEKSGVEIDSQSNFPKRAFTQEEALQTLSMYWMRRDWVEAYLLILGLARTYPLYNHDIDQVVKLTGLGIRAVSASHYLYDLTFPSEHSFDPAINIRMFEIEIAKAWTDLTILTGVQRKHF